MTPTEPGYYWADIYGSDEWEPVELFKSDFTGQWFMREFEYAGPVTPSKVQQWGPKIEFPRTIDEVSL